MAAARGRSIRLLPTAGQSFRKTANVHWAIHLISEPFPPSRVHHSVSDADGARMLRCALVVVRAAGARTWTCGACRTHFS